MPHSPESKTRHSQERRRGDSPRRPRENNDDIDQQDDEVDDESRDAQNDDHDGGDDGPKDGTRGRGRRDADADDGDEQGEDEADEKKQTKEKQKPASGRKKWIIGGIVLLVLIIVAAIGIPWWLEARHYESTDDAFIDAHWEKIAPQVSGRVEKVLVDDNALVKAGDTLLTIDPVQYQTQVEQARAAVAEAKGKLAQAKANRQVAEAGVGQAQADVDRAQTSLDNADAELKRYQGLSAEAVSKQKIDDLQTTERNAKSQLSASQKNFVAAKAQVDLAASQIEAAEASVTSAGAQLDAAKLRLSYTQIKAVTAGRVSRRSVQDGDYVSVGQQLLLLVPQKVWVTANYKETQITDMRAGQPVDIEVDAYPDHTFHGKVDSFQSGSGAVFSLLPPENATGNYVKVVQRVPVKITFDSTEGDVYQRLSPGMSVVPKVKVR